MVKQYNQKYFDVTFKNESGKIIGGMTVYCYTTNTRNGFCHHADVFHDGREYKARQSYMNRAWERFTYESTLLGLINKFPKAMREELHKQLIDEPYNAVAKRVESDLSAFQSLYDNLSTKQKDTLKNVELRSESDVKTTMGVMALMNIMGGE